MLQSKPMVKAWDSRTSHGFSQTDSLTKARYLFQKVTCKDTALIPYCHGTYLGWKFTEIPGNKYGTTA